MFVFRFLVFFMAWCVCFFLVFFFFNDTATTEIYTLSLHDALPISWGEDPFLTGRMAVNYVEGLRSEEHTSELQSHHDLVCRLLLEKKKKKHNKNKQKKKKKKNKNKKQKKKKN